MKNFYKAIAVSLLFLFSAKYAEAQSTSFDVDRTYGTACGITLISTITDVPKGSFIYPEGSVISVYGETSNPTGHSIKLVKLDANGQLDASFGIGGTVSYLGPGLLAMGIGSVDTGAGGKIFVVGHQSIGCCTGGVYIACFNVNGSLNYYSEIPVNNAAGNFCGVTVQGDGKAVCWGYDNGGNHFFMSRRFNTDGTLDNTFGGLFPITNNPVNGPGDFGYGIIQSNGQAVFCYVAQPGAGSANSELYLTRLNLDGTIDGTFGNGGFNNTGFSTNCPYVGVGALRKIAGDKMRVAGTVADCTGDPSNRGSRVMQFTANGLRDNSFGTNGAVTVYLNNTSYQTEVYDMAVDPVTDKIYFAGSAAPFVGAFIYRLNSNGSVDNTFNGNGNIIFPYYNSGRFAGNFARIGLYSTDRILVNFQRGDGAVHTVIDLSNLQLAITATPDCPAVELTLNENNSSCYSLQWYKDGVAINGANGSSYIAVTDGSYYVQGSYGPVPPGPPGLLSGTLNSNTLAVVVPPPPTWYADADNDGYGNAAVSQQVCSQPAGYLSNDDDCNDTKNAVHPGATEICNGIDDDCDNLTDTDDPSITDSEVPVITKCPGNIETNSVTGGGCGQIVTWTAPSATDNCGIQSFTSNFNSGNVFPNGLTTVTYTATDLMGNTKTCSFTINVIPAQENCNGIDDDCDGQIDEGVIAPSIYPDVDRDGFGNPNGSSAAASVSCVNGAWRITSPPNTQFVFDNTDCNDFNQNVHPGAPETCGSGDSNCDGHPMQDGTVTGIVYRDADGDGYGNHSITDFSTCQNGSSSAPPGYVQNDLDCNDSNPAIKPGATELCDGIDNNCSGAADEGTLQTFYVDADGDTYGNVAVTSVSCTQPAGFVTNHLDCDDGSAAIHPGANEICNGSDDNCNGTIDDPATFYADADGDGFGNSAVTAQACSAPSGFVGNNKDCNDANSAVNPGATETCNGMDDDCDGLIDENVKLTFYADNDGDGFGNASLSSLGCSAPPGFVTDNSDCNDNNQDVHPGLTEICGNSLDDDCNGLTDQVTSYLDSDGDGFGRNSSTSLLCPVPAGFVTVGNDCNDFNPNFYPGAPESCGSGDSNCDGHPMQDGTVTGVVYRDADGDGYGNHSVTNFSTCQNGSSNSPPGYVLNDLDCNDNNASIKPGASEVCGNGIDEDCSGSDLPCPLFLNYRTVSSGNWNNKNIWEVFDGTNWVDASTSPTSSDGTITIQSPNAVTITADVTIDEVIVNSDATLIANSNFRLNNGPGYDITCNGLLKLTNGTLVGNGPESILVTDSLFWGTMNLQVLMTLSSTCRAEFTVGGKAGYQTIINDGKVTWSAGELKVFFNGVFINNGTFLIASNDMINPGGNNFINNGILTKTNTGTTSFNQSPPDGLVNNGTINLLAGILQTNNFTNSGTINFTPSATLKINGGSFTCETGNQLLGTGTFINNSVVTLNTNVEFPSTIPYLQSGNVNGSGNLTVNNDFVINGQVGSSGNLTVNGNVDWQSGSLSKALTVDNGRSLVLTTNGDKGLSSVLTINGNLNWNDGFLGLHAGHLIIGNTGLFTINCNKESGSPNVSSRLTNNGTITKTSNGTTYIQMVDDFINNGIVNLQAGTLRTYNFVDAGIFNFTSGATLNLAGTNSTFNSNTQFTGSGTVTNNGTNIFLNTNVVFPSSIIFPKSGASIIGAGDLTVNNDFIINGNVTGTGAFTVNGNVEWQSGYIGRAFTFNNGQTVTLTTANDKVVAADIVNNGTITWSEGRFVVYDHDFVNNGTCIASNNSSLEGFRSFYNNGTFIKTSTGTITFAADFRNNGGTLKGVGTISANAPFFANGTIEPGTSPGILTFNGNQPFSANSTFKIELTDGSGAGTGHDLLQRTGNLTLAGTLSATVTCGSALEGDYTIISVTGGTITGTFAAVNIPAGDQIIYNSTTVVYRRNLHAWYRDADVDGFGNFAEVICSVTQPVGYVSNSLDCNDNQVEYADNDGDGFGFGPAIPCLGVINDLDCDDANKDVHPGAAEICNGMDDDCNGLADNDDPLVTGRSTWYEDGDRDGFGNAAKSLLSCHQPSGYVSNSLDCDDTEINYVDKDSDGFGVNIFSACSGVTSNLDCNDRRVEYADNDGDGFGFGSFVPCNGVTNNSDCDDAQKYFADNDGDGFGSEPYIPCPGVTNNLDCDDNRAEYADNDGDGFGFGPLIRCSGVTNNSDCDDADNKINQDAIEICNGADDDCDGFIDSDDPSVTGDYCPCTDITTISGCGVSVSAIIEPGAGAYRLSCDLNADGKEKIFSFTPTESGKYYIFQFAAPSIIFYSFKPASGGCTNPNWTCIGQLQGSAGVSASLEMNLSAGVEYYILIDPLSAAGGTVNFNIECDPCLSISTINGCGVSNSVTIDPGFGVYRPNTCTGIPLTTGKGKIFSFTPAESGIYHVLQIASSFSKTDYLFKPASDGCSKTGWICIGSLSDPMSLSSSLNFNLIAGVEYYIFVLPQSITGGTVSFSIDCLAPDPCLDISTIAKCGDLNTATFSRGAGLYQSLCGIGSSGLGREKIFRYTPTETGICRIFQSSSFAGFNYLYKPVSDGCSGSGWTCIDVLYGTGFNQYSSSPGFNLTAGIEYYFLVKSLSNRYDETVTFSIVSEQCSNICYSVSNIEGCGITKATSLHSGEGLYSNPGNCELSFTDGQESVYTFTPAVSGAYDITQFDATFNDNGPSHATSVVYFFKPVTDGCAGTGWNCIGRLYNAATSAAFNLTAGIEYYILLDHHDEGNAVNLSFKITCPLTTWYLDADNDGFGNASLSQQSFSQPSGYVANNNDCNDSNSAVNPAATEICNSIDDNCNNQTDEGNVCNCIIPEPIITGPDIACPGSIKHYSVANPVAGTTYTWVSDGLETITNGQGTAEVDIQFASQNYLEAFLIVRAQNSCGDIKSSAFFRVGGVPAVSLISPVKTGVCGKTIDYSASTFNAVSIFWIAPAGATIINGQSTTTVTIQYPPSFIDGILSVLASNECGTDRDDELHIRGEANWYRDADGDGFGNAAVTFFGCPPPTGYVADKTDCNDTKSSVHPGAPEICDGLDNDCDGLIDMNDPSLTGPTASSNSPVCKGSALNLFANGSGVTFFWTGPNGFSSFFPDPSISNVTGSASGQYVLTITYANGCATSSSTTVAVGTPPQIITQPSASVVCAGNSVDFFCGVTGTNLHYQWRKFGVLNINGATNAHYTIPSATINDGGTYEVVISGDCPPSVVSQQVLLTVTFAPTWYEDADHDGFGNASVSIQQCSQPSGYVTNNKDCNDSDPSVGPEIQCYIDGDSDGYGTGSATLFCLATPPSGYSINNTDCNDAVNSIHPGATEACNQTDDDCDGLKDEQACAFIYYPDADGDSYGNPALALGSNSPVPPAGYVTIDRDCDDGNANIHPGAVEICNGFSDDCDLFIDADDFDFVGGNTDWYRDNDHDGYGNPLAYLHTCFPPSDYVSNNLDCDDADATATLIKVFYRDLDGDGFGNPLLPVGPRCYGGVGLVDNDDDCQDRVLEIYPGASEICNGVDDDCDGLIDTNDPSVTGVPTWYADTDGDGYGNLNVTVQACNQPAGYLSNDDDCNDGNASIHPVTPNSEKWTTKASIPSSSARNLAVSFTIGNKSYVGTGFSGSSEVKDFWEYDPATNTWTRKADFGGEARRSAVGFSIGNKGYIGFGGSTQGGLFKDLWEYDPAINTWTRKTDFPGQGFLFVTGLAIAGKGYVGVGATDHTFWEYDPVTDSWTRKADFPGSPRREAAGFCLGTKGYFGTGAEYNFNTQTYLPLKDLWEYNPVTNIWTRKIDFAGTARFGSAAFNLGNRGYLVGGNNATDLQGLTTHMLPDFWEYDPSAGALGAWTQKINFVPVLFPTGFSNGSHGYVSIGNTLSEYSLADVVEICNGLDDNCNGLTDDSDPSVIGQSIWFADSDGDGYGVSSVNVIACSKPNGYSAAGGDCNDNNVTANPAASELCNGIDDNCNGSIDEGHACDQDGDGYTVLQGDCDDNNIAISPGATEICNGLDDDCDGLTDDADPSAANTSKTVWYADADEDGFGNLIVTQLSCLQPNGYVINDDDCNDNNASIHPPTPNPDIWNTKASIPVSPSRNTAVSFTIGNKSYVGTGYDGNDLKDFWEYSPSTNTWTRKADFGGAARMGAIGFSIGNKGYIGLGGSQQNGTIFKDLWEYDPAANTWTKKADFPGVAFAYGVGVTIGNRGYAGMEGNRTFWEYNPVTDSWTRKADFPGVPRRQAMGFCIGNKGYFGTGTEFNSSSPTPFLPRNDFWEYDPVTNIWTRKADFAGSPRFGSAAFSLGSKGYLVSGTNATTLQDFILRLLPDFWEYDPSAGPSGTWTQKINFGQALFPTAFTNGTHGYVSVGSSLREFHFTDGIEICNGIDDNCNGQIDEATGCRGKIIAAEYFWDTDPGQDNATPLAALDGNFNEAFEQAIAGSTVTLSDGIHKLGVRVRGIDGVWSSVFSSMISVEQGARLVKITQAEYFWDTDPGQGSATPLIAFDGNFNEAFEQGIASPLATTPESMHKLGVRVRGADGAWSAVFFSMVSVEGRNRRLVKITQGEFFWDTDPGEGNATAMVAFDGNFNEAFEQAKANPFNNLTQGIHKLGVRVRGEDGAWSSVFFSMVSNEPPLERAVKIISAEYFWDTDPGAGNAIPLLALDGSLNEAFEQVKGESVFNDAGLHTLNVRVRGADGAWSSVMKSMVSVCEPQLPGNISGKTIVCPDAKEEFSIEPVIGATSYKWSISGATLNSPQGRTSVSVIFPSTFTTVTIRVEAINNCGTSGLNSGIIVQPIPIPATPGAINGNTSACAGAKKVRYSIAAVNGAASYKWGVSDGTIFSGQGTTSIELDFPVAYASLTINVQSINSCDARSDFSTLKIVPPAVTAVPKISGPKTVCDGSTNTYSVTAIDGANSYLWAVTPSNTAFISGQGSKEVAVSFLVGNYSLTCKSVNACGVASATTNINISTKRCQAQPVPRLERVDSTNNTSFAFYPNPTQSDASIVFTIGDYKHYKIRIIDVTGKLMQKMEGVSVPGENTISIDVSWFSNGVYLATLISDLEEPRTIKFVKQ